MRLHWLEVNNDYEKNTTSRIIDGKGNLGI